MRGSYRLSHHLSNSERENIYATATYGTRQTYFGNNRYISIRRGGVISGRSRTRGNVQGDRYWAGDIGSTKKRTR